MMTVIEMARLATNGRIAKNDVETESLIGLDEVTRFAELVRADMKERCAKMCDQLAIEDGLHQAKYCANAIRGRMDE